MDHRLVGKDPDAGSDWGWEENRTTEDDMAEWHHWLNGHELVNSGSLWWTGRPDVLRFMGSQSQTRLSDWTELNWWIMEEAREFQKPSASLTTLKPLTVWITTNWKIGIPDRNTRPPYMSPEKLVCRSRSNRTRHGTMDWIQIGKGVCQGWIFTPCLSNLYAEYIMQNARLEEAKLGSRLLGEISITSDKQKTPPLWQKAKKN